MRLSLRRRGLSQDGAVRARSRQHVRSKPVFGIMVGWPFVSLLPDSSLCMSVYLSAGERILRSCRLTHLPNGE